MSPKPMSEPLTPAQEAGRRAGLRGLRSQRPRTPAAGRGQTRRAPASRMRSAATAVANDAPLSRYERNMARLVSVSLWGGMAGYLLVAAQRAFVAAAQAAARSVGLVAG